MITVRKLARAIERRLGGMTAEALNEARTVMSYFGFASQIIDNVIQPEDRKLFYNLADAGLLQTFWETVPLLDGRNWRIFYWSLNDRDIDRIDRKSTRLNSSHITISYAVFCLKKK